MINKYPRIAITGLPGSGKTTLAKLLLVNRDKRCNVYIVNRDYAFVHGDEILPNNIVKVCRVLDKFVAEHFCIADLMAKELLPPIDLIVMLDIPEDICRERIKLRGSHQVQTPLSFQMLRKEMLDSLKLLSDKGVTIVSINEQDETFIHQQKLIGLELMNYLLENGKLLKIDNAIG